MTRETWVQSQVESYQRLKKWYLMPPCLTISVIRYRSRVKWNNPGKGVVPSLIPWCSSYRKFGSPSTTSAHFIFTYVWFRRSLSLSLSLSLSHTHTHIYIYIIIIIIIMSRRHRGYPWPSLAISPYHSSLPAGLQGYILCPHIVAVCKFVLVVLLLHIHRWGSTGVHRLWARPCFSSSVPRVWFV